MDYKTLFTNEDLLAVYKPAGIPTQKTEDHPGFFNLINEASDDSLYLLHRLDKVTSGILLLAKSKEAASYYGKLFENKKIKKTYLAISKNKPSKKQGHIIGDMEKGRGGKWMLKRSRENPSHTYFQSISLEEGFRLFVLYPKTGKTHQLRVALKSIGAPILGDPLYSAKVEFQTQERCYLHAFQLEVEDIKISVLPNEGKYFNHEQLALKIENLMNKKED